MLKLRYYQEDAVNAFFNYVSDNHYKHPLIVIPTAGGKSLVMATIVKEMLSYEGTRVLLPTHRKQLIQQNYEEFMKLMNGDWIDAGIYSAGLKTRDTRSRVLFAGIQSIHKRAWELGFFDLILVDEAHRISNEKIGTYRNFLEECTRINPKIVIAGLSATPYRLKQGLLCEGDDKIFDEICYEAKIPELMNANHFRNRDKQQYLCTLISKSGVNKVDLSQVHIRGGEYIPGEMEKAFEANDLVAKAVKEIKEYTVNRNKTLVFTAGIKHCEHVSDALNKQGLPACYIHSQQSEEINDANIEGFKSGEFKYLVNVDKLTEGFNARDIDCIILLRSTMSPGLYYQMVGRGLRLHQSKEDCLILDFGRNIETHGPIDRIEIRKKKDGTREVATAPQKECPECHQLLFISVMVCPTCGYRFPEQDKHEETASNADIISKWKKPEVHTVQRIEYNRHEKQDKPDSMRVDYYIGLFDKYSEYVCLDHEGFARTKALQWILARNTEDVPEPITTVDLALDYCHLLKKPTQITVNINGKFPQIIGYNFNPLPESEKSETKNWTNELEINGW